MIIFTVLARASQEVDAEIEIWEQVVYLGHEGNTSSGLEKCDEEEYLIKPTTTMGY